MFSRIFVGFGELGRIFDFLLGSRDLGASFLFSLSGYNLDESPGAYCCLFDVGFIFCVSL